MRNRHQAHYPFSIAIFTFCLAGLTICRRADGQVAEAYKLAADSYRNAAQGACTSEAKSCYLKQADYYDCLARAGNCVPPAQCAGSGCAAGQTGGSAAANNAATADLNERIGQYGREVTETRDALREMHKQVDPFDRLMGALGPSGLDNALDQLMNAIGAGKAGDSFDHLVDSLNTSAAAARPAKNAEPPPAAEAKPKPDGSACHGVPVPDPSGWTPPRYANFGGIQLGCSVTIEAPCSPSQKIELTAVNRLQQEMAVELEWLVQANVRTAPSKQGIGRINPGGTVKLAVTEIDIENLNEMVRARARACEFRNVRIGFWPISQEAQRSFPGTYVSPQWSQRQNGRVELPAIAAAPDEHNVLDIPKEVTFPGRK